MQSQSRSISAVAVVGTGVIGRSWVQVFSRAGFRTRIYDNDPAQVNNALSWLSHDLTTEYEMGLISAEEIVTRRSLVSVHETLEEAMSGVSYVQESGPDQIEAKKKIYQELDRKADPRIILASSTSGLDMSIIADGLQGAHRCIVAHPVNPPHLIPVVEVLPGEKTDAEVISQTCKFMESIGQTPVLMNFYVRGFLLNRMQSALLREAIDLVISGVADVNSVDAVIRDGLGLRWALMGPFAVANTNADGGIREYLTRYGQAFIDCMDELGPTPSFDPTMIEILGRETDAMEKGASLRKTREWRDRLIRRIRKLKTEDPHPIGS